MSFEIVGEITQIETIAAAASIRELPRLRRLYGRGRWRKVKGIALVRCGAGRSGGRNRTGMKRKRYVDKTS